MLIETSDPLGQLVLQCQEGGLIVLARSYMFVPGDKADALAKADRRGADALIVDLEDAVAPSNKARAREVTARWLR